MGPAYLSEDTAPVKHRLYIEVLLPDPKDSHTCSFDSIMTSLRFPVLLSTTTYYFVAVFGCLARPTGADTACLTFKGEP